MREPGTGLTRRQRDLLAFIDDYMRTHDGIAPSYAEMAAGIGVTSKSNSHRLLRALRDRGYLDWLPSRARSSRMLRTPGKWRCPHCGAPMAEDRNSGAGDAPAVELPA